MAEARRQHHADEALRARLDYERYVLLYYNDPSKRRDAARLARRLLHVPELFPQNVLYNCRFYVTSAPRGVETDLAPLAEQALGDAAFVASSPSIVAEGTGYLVNVRLVDYRMDDRGFYTLRDGYTLHTRNVTLRLDGDLHLLDAARVADAFRPDERVRGLEDLKLVRGTELHCCGTWVVQGRPCMAVAPYPLEGAPRVVPSPEGRACEKNWCCFEHEGRLRVVYQWWPLTVFDLDAGALSNRVELRAPGICRHFRGSSNGCRCGEELWFVVHLVLFGEPRWYYNAFVVLDGTTLRVLRISVPFKNAPQTPIEFVLGLVVEEARVLLTYSTHDSTARLRAYQRSDIEALF